uniref:BZIP domain-containing protein n=1 Tax=Scylla olivacea TaxID=85551 RepID=A0A0P4VYE9_SCYOL
MSDNERPIDNPLYAGMSLKDLLESADLFDLGWRDLKGAEGKSGGTKEEGEKKEGGEWEPYNAGAAFLGPTLWDKTLSYDSDLKLEYMDLDEFLNENGIPIEEANKALGRGGGGGGGGGDGGGRPNATKGSSNNSGGGGSGDMTSPAASMSPDASSPSSPDGTPMGLGAMPQGPPQPGPHPTMPQLTNNPTTPAPQPPHSVPPPCLSPDDHRLDDCCSPDSGSPHSPALQVHEGDSIRASLGREKVRGCPKLSTKGNAAKEGQQIGLTIDFEVSPNDLALATVPGQDFDPRTRMFTEDELKPQPMIKKSRKQFVPAELKDDKYWARRRKNNLAAKRSRDARRLKENQIAMRANFLEKENDALTSELQKAQSVVEALKKRLAVYEVV